MEQNVTMDDLNTNETILASCALQQLPKILLALSNMARRSRQRMQRKGVFLGGLWLNEELLEDEVPKQKQGILKASSRKPSLSLLSTYNDVWKAYSYSYPSDVNDEQAGKYWSVVSSPGQKSESHSTFTNHLCSESLENQANFLQATTSPGILPGQLLFQPSVQGILLCRLRGMLMDSEESLILMHLFYLKMLSNIPVHKLLRGRPTEFILPLPRRARGLSASNIKSLVGLQCVRDLPKSDNKAKWLNFLGYSNTPNKFGCTEFGDDPELISVVKSKHYKKTYPGRCLGITVPKGVSFLTYPDSMDETSFEGTIGGRSLISWEKGTKFPQMGIDQSLQFKCRRELSRQTMIHNRLRAAKFQRRMTYIITPIEPIKKPPFWRSYRKLIPRVLRRNAATSTAQPSTNPLLKLTQFRKSLRFITKRNSVSSSQTPREVEEVLRCPEVDDTTLRLIQKRKAAEKAERRKRLKLRIMTILKYLSCGLIPYIATGECKIFKRKRRISRVDSRERCENGTSLVITLESQLPSSSVTSPV